MRILMTVAATAAALGLSACGGEGGGSDVRTLASVCVAEAGFTAAQCSCMANRAQDELTEDQFALLLASAQDDESAGALSANMSIADAMSVANFFDAAEAACGVGD